MTDIPTWVKPKETGLPKDLIQPVTEVALGEKIKVKGGQSVVIGANPEKCSLAARGLIQGGDKLVKLVGAPGVVSGAVVRIEIGDDGKFTKIVNLSTHSKVNVAFVNGITETQEDLAPIVGRAVSPQRIAGINSSDLNLLRIQIGVRGNEEANFELVVAGDGRGNVGKPVIELMPRLGHSKVPWTK